jgi:hypothetical protein
VAEGLGPWRAPGTTGGVSSNERDRSGLERNLGGVGRSHSHCGTTEAWSFYVPTELAGSHGEGKHNAVELELLALNHLSCLPERYNQDNRLSKGIDEMV